MESSGNDTGGVIAFPSDPFADANLTTWDRLGPTRWEPCNASAWPSPIWLNPHTHRFNLLAVHGFGEARFEAEDESLQGGRWPTKLFRRYAWAGRRHVARAATKCARSSRRAVGDTSSRRS